MIYGYTPINFQTREQLKVKKFIDFQIENAPYVSNIYLHAYQFDELHKGIPVPLCDRFEDKIPYKNYYLIRIPKIQKEENY